MDKRLEKFLEFNGKRIAVLLADGTWWVAVKPICEALEIDYEKQRERISRHQILSQLPTKQGVVAADGKVREMLCLPEKYVYGWLFSINSDSPELIEYQQKCYDVLFDHFHGAMTGRMTALTERSETDIEIHELEQAMNLRLMETEEYKRIQELRAKQKQISKRLKELDAELLSGQLSFDFHFEKE